MACCLCCAAPTMILVVLGMMNPFVIIGVAIIISAEKVLPRPAIVVRLIGIVAIIAGVMATLHKLEIGSPRGTPWRSGDRTDCQQNRKNGACKAPKKCGFGFVTDGIAGEGRFSTNDRKSRTLRN